MDSKNSQTIPTTSTTPVRQLLGAPDAQMTHIATSSTAPAHQPLGSVNAETTPAGAPAAAADSLRSSEDGLRRAPPTPHAPPTPLCRGPIGAFAFVPSQWQNRDFKDPHPTASVPDQVACAVPMRAHVSSHLCSRRAPVLRARIVAQSVPCKPACHCSVTKHISLYNVAKQNPG